MKILLLGLLSAIGQTAAAQVNIICPGLTDSSLNYLYIGIDNPVEVVGTNIPPGYSLSISGGGASLQKVNSNKYIVRTSVVTDELAITMYNNKKIVFKKEFKTRSVPEPLASLAGFRDTTISRSKILVNPFLIINYPGCYFRFGGGITSFTTIFINDRDSISLKTAGYYFDYEQLRILKESPSGIIIYFTDLRGNFADSRSRKFRPFYIKVE